MQYHAYPGEEVERIYTVIDIAQRFPGWSLEYIESFSEERLAQIYGVLEGQQRYEKMNKPKRRSK